MKYHYVLSEEALGVFAAGRPRERAILLHAFREVADFPEAADVERTVAGFRYCRKRIGRWDLTWRVDGPVKMVIIIDVEPAR